MERLGEQHHVDDEPHRRLRQAALLYGFGTLVHTVDHWRRGSSSVTKHVFVVGDFGTILAFVTIALVLVGYRYGPHLAAAVAFPHGIGIAAVHFLPYWGAFSDALYGARRGPGMVPLSWAAVLLEVAGALVTGIAAVQVLRSTPQRRFA